MPFVLPASVRLAPWMTAAFRGDVHLDTALTRAHPGVDNVRGDLVRIREWAELGERTLLVALPRPGDLTGMPRAGPAACAAAAEAGECVFVAGSGGLLVPELSRFGPAGDEGVAATWTAYDSEPVARHVLDALSLADLERALVDLLRRSTAELEQVGGVPWSSDPREEADRSLAGARWGLPDELSPGRCGSWISPPGSVTSRGAGWPSRARGPRSRRAPRSDGNGCSGSCRPLPAPHLPGPPTSRSCSLPGGAPPEGHRRGGHPPRTDSYTAMVRSPIVSQEK